MNQSTFLRDFMQAEVSLVEKRVYRGRSPDGTGRPYIVMYLITDSDGQLGSRNPRLQFSCFAESYGLARAVADQVREAIEALNPGIDEEGNEKEMQNGIYAAYVAGDRESYDQDSQLHHVPIDGVFYYQDKFIWG